jgi:hypothetical protein
VKQLLTSSPEPYELRLSNNPRWALTEGSIFFEGKGDVQKSLHRIAERLNTLQIPYAIVGGMALFHHGVRRFTEDVDLLVSRDSLKLIHEKLEGLGYITPFAGSKNLRDTETGVKIEFLISGAFPGDGKEKPVAFPAPETVSFEKDGIKYLNLTSLVQLKLASGMTNDNRQKDLVDVSALISELNLPVEFAEQLHEYVRPAFRDLWKKSRKRYIRFWSKNEATQELQQMLADGVLLDSDNSTRKDHTLLVTTDPKLAAKYDMHAEEEFWDSAQNNPSDHP